MISKLLQAIGGLFRSAPQSFMRLARLPRPASTSKLYVIELDFATTEDYLKNLDATLEPLRQKFGMTFFVKEPGVTLKRFDDF